MPIGTPPEWALRCWLKCLFPAFPFMACGERLSEASKTLSALGALQGWIRETTPTRGTRTRMSSGNNQGAPIPGKLTRVPRTEGWSVAGCGKKWEMTLQDYPFLWQGDIVRYSPLP